MASRLPIPNQDNNVWGTILNDYLSVEHNGDGTLKTEGSLALKAPLNSPTFSGTVTVPTPSSGTQAANKAYVDNAVISELGFVTPMQYGANGNGSGNDTAAVAAALATGKPVYIAPDKIYGGLTTQLITAAIGQRIYGGGKLVWASGIAGLAGIRIAHDGVSVEGITLSNPNELGNLTGARGYGILIVAHNIKVTSCTIDRFQNSIHVSSGGEYYNIQILNNRVIDNIGAAAEDRGDGITFNGAHGIIIGNIINAKAGSDCRIGIHTEGLGGSKVTAGAHDNAMITIQGNIVSGSFRRGIVAEDTANVVISGNAVSDSRHWEIALIRARSSSVTGNTIVRTAGTRLGSIDMACIYLYGETQNCIVDDNTIRLATANGSAIDTFIQCEVGSIGASDWVTDTTISNNVLFLSDADPSTSGTATNGIKINTSTRLRVIGNSIVGSTSRGIWWGASNDFECFDNRITGAVGDLAPTLATGIENTGGSNGKFERNVIQNTTSKAMKIYNQTGDTLITGNYLFTANQGIDLFGCAGGTVRDNWFNTVTTLYGTVPGTFVSDPPGTSRVAFSSNGTWSKPVGATIAHVTVIASGGGGGGGRSTMTFMVSDLSSTVTVTVPAAPAGGAAITTNDTDGMIGSDNGTTYTSFGQYCRALGGGGGGAGSTTAGAAGAAGGAAWAGAAGGASSGSGGAGGVPGVASAGAVGGGAGGGITAANAESAGGGGAVTRASNYGSTAVGGAAGGGVGLTPTSTPTDMGLPGLGGGGGGSSRTTAAGIGGNGASYGGGGGGGGASLNGNNSGAGGAGAPGIVLVITQ